MTTYRYLTTDIQTGAVLSELPLSGVSFQHLLNGAGSMKGQLKLSDRRVRDSFNPESMSQPGSCGLVVLLDDMTLLWGGVIWTRSYDFPSETLALGASEWFSVFGRRKVLADHAWNTTAIETAVGDVVTDIQTGANATLGLTVAGATGLTVTSSVLAADRQWAADTVKAILKAAGSAGIDFRTDVVYSGNAIVPVLTLGTPTLGRDGPTSGLTVAEPISGAWSEDATQWATTVYAASRGSGATAATASVTNTAALTAGYPRWDLEYASDSDTTSATLTVAAQRYLDDRSPGGAFGSLMCRATDPDVSQIRLGDTIMVTFSPNPRFPDGLAQDARITGWTLTPGEGGGVDELAVELSDVSSSAERRSSDDVARMLASNLSRLEKLERAAKGTALVLGGSPGGGAAAAAVVGAPFLTQGPVSGATLWTMPVPVLAATTTIGLRVESTGTWTISAGINRFDQSESAVTTVTHGPATGGWSGSLVLSNTGIIPVTACVLWVKISIPGSDEVRTLTTSIG